MDRDTVTLAGRYLRKANDAISDRALGPAAKAALLRESDDLAHMVTLQWLRQHFPTNPSLAGLSIRREALPAGDTISLFDLERLSFEARRNVVQTEPIEVVEGLLADLAKAHRDARKSIVRLPGGKGGQPRGEVRRLVIVSLAERFRSLGRKVQAGEKSEFVRFCTDLFDAMGWSSETKGLQAAVAATLKSIYRG
jgi:hypothetical protein